MRNILKKPVPLFIARVLLGLILILGSYYLFILRPSLAIPQKLFDIRKILVEAQYNALQNRIAHIGLTRLNPASGRFTYSRERHLTNIEKTVKKARERQQKPLSLPKSEGLEGNFISFLKGVSETLPGLYEKEVKNYEEQAKLIEKANGFNKVVEKIYLYRTSRDIGELNLESETDRQTAAVRARATSEGLEAIKKELALLDFEKEVISQLREEISQTQEVFEKLAAFPSKTNYENARDQFNDLRKKTFEVEKQIMLSEAGIKFLTEQTNLLLSYNFLLNELGQIQKKIESR